MTHTHARLTLSGADRAGTCLSLLCAIQCIATPLLGATLTLTGMEFLVHESTESLPVMVSVGLGAGSLGRGFHLHGQWRVVLILAVALALIAVGRFGVNSPYETVLVVAGAGMLAAGHLVNRHLCGTRASCACGDIHRQP